jgi:hypothetical protein
MIRYGAPCERQAMPLNIKSNSPRSPSKGLSQPLRDLDRKGSRTWRRMVVDQSVRAAVRIQEVSDGNAPLNSNELARYDSELPIDRGGANLADIPCPQRYIQCEYLLTNSVLLLIPAPSDANQRTKSCSSRQCEIGAK